MDCNQQVFLRQYPAVVFFVRHLACFRGLKAAWDRVTDHIPFWAWTTDGHLKLATIAWCNVFGTDNEAIHWKKTPAGPHAEQARQDFRARLLSRTGRTPEQWSRYHKDMLNFRNTYVAHYADTAYTDPVPNFDPALEVAYAYDGWVRALTQPAIWEQPPLSSVYEQWRAWAHSVVARDC